MVMTKPLYDLGNFGVSHYLCPPECALPAFLDAAAKAGFTSIGLTERALSEMPLTVIRQQLNSRQLSVSSINTAGYFFFNDERQAAQTRINEALLCAASELDAVNGVNLIVGGTALMELGDARDYAFEQSCRLAERAKALGTRLLLEPMHPIQATGKGCVNTLAQAYEWTQTIDNIVLNLDLFHSWWDPQLEQALSGQLSPLGVLQVCDVSIDPISMMPSRVGLNEGQARWFEAIRLLLQNARNVPIELELFAAQLTSENGLDLLASNARIIQKALQETSI